MRRTTHLQETSLSQLQRVKISALGTYVPPRLLTNGDLEKMVETNDQWIMERVVIGADVMSSIIDYTDRATCVIFGDGAGAVLLEPAENESVGLIDFLHEVDGSGGCSLYMPGGGSLNPSTHETVDKKMHFVHQDGAAVFKFAVRKMASLCEEILRRNNIKGCEIDAFIPHQANKRIITATAARLSMRPDARILNIEHYGNTTAATIPLAMETARQEGKLKKGSLVLLASVGAGFTSGVTLLRWAY